MKDKPAAYEITLSCSFCSAEHRFSVDLPAGWDSRYEGVDDEAGFCPKHSIITKWAEAQCPGCVSGWGDCELFRSFACSDSTGLSREELDQIRKGVCPKRVGGTIAVSPSGIGSLDLTETAPAPAGQALATAIEEYWDLANVAEPYHGKSVATE